MGKGTLSTLEIGRALGQLLQEIDLQPFRAEEGTRTPFATYTLTGLRVATSKDRYNYREVATVEITTVADDYETAVEFTQFIRDRLEGFEGEIDGIDIGDITLQAARASSPAVEIYIHSLTYSITIL